MQSVYDVMISCGSNAIIWQNSTGHFGLGGKLHGKSALKPVCCWCAGIIFAWLHHIAFGVCKLALGEVLKIRGSPIPNWGLTSLLIKLVTHCRVSCPRSPKIRAKTMAMSMNQGIVIYGVQEHNTITCHPVLKAFYCWGGYVLRNRTRAVLTPILFITPRKVPLGLQPAFPTITSSRALK